MDAVMAKLPSEVGTNLEEHIAIIEIVSMFSIGAYNALETVFIMFKMVQNYRDQYFWSMQIASWDILVHAIPAIVCLISRTQSADVNAFLDWMVRHGHWPICCALLTLAPCCGGCQ